MEEKKMEEKNIQLQLQVEEVHSHQVLRYYY